MVMALRADDLGNGGNLSSRDNGAFGAASNNIGLTAATHGMRMDWNEARRTTLCGGKARNERDTAL